VPAVSSSTVTFSTSSDAVGPKPSDGASRRSSERIAGSCAASAVASMPAKRAGTRWPGFTPWSARNRRTSVTSRCTAASSASARASTYDDSAEGHEPTTRDSPPVNASQSRSVTNGITGCSSRNSRSSTCPNTARVAVAAAPPADSDVLASSTYQSQNSDHANAWIVSQTLANSYAS
jgi:hypothetical protein